jgi:hypothetical protein
MAARVLPACAVLLRQSVVTTALFVAVLVSLVSTRPVARTAAAGSISGRITSSTNGLGLQGTKVQFFDINADEFLTAMATTDANGDYSMSLPAGLYGVMTQDTHGHINEIYDNIKCSSTCDTSNVTLIDVTTTAVTGIDFVLDPGARVSGTVTNSSNGQPIAGVRVYLVPTIGDQFPFTAGITDATGNFITAGGAATGNVIAVTENFLGFQDEVYDNIKCLGCDVGDLGTPIAVTSPTTTSGINFALDPGAQITGNVTDSNSTPLANVEVSVYGPQNWVASTFTDGSGNYSTPGLPTGSYRVGTRNGGMLVDELYNNVTCPDQWCDVLTGTIIPVTAPNAAAGINFVLSAGGRISGTVTAAAGGTPLEDVVVGILNSSGAFVTGAQTDSNGAYMTGAMPPGTYFAVVTGVPGFANQIYNGGTCGIFCNTANGTGINVVANQTNSGINFALQPGGSITGTVTSAANGTPLTNFQVQLFSSTGLGLGSVNTNASGVFTMTGLAPASYYVRTNQASTFVNQLYNGVTCVGCNVTASGGTLVPVTAGVNTPNINFALATGGRISGTITNANGGAPLQGVTAGVFNSSGVGMGGTNTSASGVYTSFAVPAGTYFVRTNNTLGFINELFDNISCPATSCNVTTGTPINVTVGAITPNINFALTAGGAISGTVTNQANGQGIANLQVQLFNSSGTFLGGVNTNNSGAYTTSGVPPGNYFLRTNNTQGFLDELYDNILWTGVNVTTGTPVAVSTGVTTPGINFALVQGGGSISGTVTNAVTGQPLVGIQVQVHAPSGFVVKSQQTNASGQYTLTGLPAGTYYGRTNTPLYVDELYDGKPCFPNCTVQSGTAIVVSDGNTESGVDFSLAPNLVQNGRFNSGASNWTLFATPDMSYIVSQIVGGVFEYYRNPPPLGTTNQAVVFQNTNIAVPTQTALTARFSLGNSSSVRKRISVLVIDGDFSDISVCTFWIPPGTPMTPYRMHTHTTKAWTNAAIYFYAATAGSNGGFYRLDDVALELAPGGATNETECVDPFVPVPPGGAPGPDLLVNGNFNTGTLAPWITFGTITHQIVAGVFEFIRNAGQPAGVVFQSTGQAMTANQILTATMQLGNSSGVRKRVTVILHDLNFGDLSACTFWLAPGQPLSDYAVQTYATQAWTNATLSVYGATAGPEQWIRLDNATFRRTPASVISGTNCIEPGATPNSAAASAPMSTGVATSGERAVGDPVVGRVSRPGDQPNAAAGPDLETMIDLRSSIDARLRLDSFLTGDTDAFGELQASVDGVTWITLGVVRADEGWETLDIDLSPFAGHTIRLRFIVTGSRAGREPQAVWRIAVTDR